MNRHAFALVSLIALGAAVHPGLGHAAPPTEQAAAIVHYRSVQVDGVRIAYREAGPREAPVLLLLHGFPTSSRMFRNLIPALADRYRLIAPDYPGFGASEAPDHVRFAYSFEHLASVMDDFARQVGATRYALYVQDYGAPIGFRLAVRHPERITALIVQNGNAYEEGLSPFWTPLKAAWADPSPANRAALRAGLTLEATRSQYLGGVADPSHIDPENWMIDHALMQRPGVDEIMLDLFVDYGANVAAYPGFHRFFRERKPPTLIVWGRNDEIFPVAGARAYLRDLPDAELHLLDSGHFALEDKGPEIAELIRGFLARKLPPAS
jgi:pimeloyl-ACP methyl ester carboxylesterase